MTLLKTKIKKKAKEVVKYTKRKVKKIAKKLSKPKKKNPIYTDESGITFKEMLSPFDFKTRSLVYDIYEQYESGNERRGIDSATPKQIAGMIKKDLGDNNYTFGDAHKLMAVVYDLNQLPKNTEIYLPSTR